MKMLICLDDPLWNGLSGMMNEAIKKLIQELEAENQCHD